MLLEKMASNLSVCKMAEIAMLEATLVNLAQLKKVNAQ